MLLLNCRFLSILVYCNGTSIELLILSLPIFNSLNTKLFSVFSAIISFKRIDTELFGDVRRFVFYQNDSLVLPGVNCGGKCRFTLDDLVLQQGHNTTN